MYGFLLFHIKPGFCLDHLALYGGKDIIVKLYVSNFTQYRIRVIRFGDHRLKILMCNDSQFIYIGHSCTFSSVRQTQTSTYLLLHQYRGIGRPQWHNRIKIGHVPAFFQHVHVDDDFNLIVRLFQGDKKFVHFFVFLSGTVYLKHLTCIPATEHIIFYPVIGFFGMLDILANNQYERLD